MISVQSQQWLVDTLLQSPDDKTVWEKLFQPLTASLDQIYKDIDRIQIKMTLHIADSIQRHDQAQLKFDYCTRNVTHLALQNPEIRREMLKLAEDTTQSLQQLKNDFFTLYRFDGDIEQLEETTKDTWAATLYALNICHKVDVNETDVRLTQDMRDSMNEHLSTTASRNHILPAQMQMLRDIFAKGQTMFAKAMSPQADTKLLSEKLAELQNDIVTTEFRDIARSGMPQKTNLIRPIKVFR